MAPLITKDQVLEQAKTSISNAEIARKLNCSENVVFNISHKYNIVDDLKTTYKQNRLNHLPRPCSRKYKTENIFKDDTEASFYVAGFIAADGCICNRGYTVKIEIAEKDFSHLELLKSLMNSEQPIFHTIRYDKRYDKNRYGCNLQINSKEIADTLKRFDIGPRKSLIYTMPEWLLCHPLVRHFLRGYIDGDGSYYFRHNNNNKSQPKVRLLGSRRFLEQVDEIFIRNCNINKTHRKIRTIKNAISVIEFGGTLISNRIIDFLYDGATVYLDRKKEITNKIRSLTPVLSLDDVYDFANKSRNKFDMSENIMKSHNYMVNCSPKYITQILREHNITCDIKDIFSKNKKEYDIGANKDYITKIFEIAKQCDTQVEMAKMLNVSNKYLNDRIINLGCQAEIKNILKYNKNNIKELSGDDIILKNKILDTASKSKTRLELRQSLDLGYVRINNLMNKFNIINDVKSLIREYNDTNKIKLIFDTVNKCKTTREICKLIDMDCKHFTTEIKRLGIRDQILDILANNRLLSTSPT